MESLSIFTWPRPTYVQQAAPYTAATVKWCKDIKDKDQSSIPLHVQAATYPPRLGLPIKLQARGILVGKIRRIKLRLIILFVCIPLCFKRCVVILLLIILGGQAICKLWRRIRKEKLERNSGAGDGVLILFLYGFTSFGSYCYICCSWGGRRKRDAEADED